MKRTDFTYYKSELKDVYIIINTDFIIMGIFSEVAYSILRKTFFFLNHNL